MASKLIKPPRLSAGDVIGIAAPAGPFAVEILERGIDAIKKMGFDVMVPDNLQHPDKYLAAPDEHRALLLQNLFNSPDIKGIICAEGGYGSIRILDLIDFDLIRNHPKIFLGFSDISALISTINIMSGLVTFHGPQATCLNTANHQTKASLYRVLTSGKPLEIIPENPSVIQSGRATGVVAGGNLATLCHLLGTRYSPIYRGCIFVMEDTREPHYKIDRMLFQMRMAGCFHGISGIVMGSFHDCGKYERICDIVKNLFEDLQVPILSGFDIGHGETNLTIPMGIRATLDTNQSNLVFHDSATIR
jgi:muramoyltetrapeptide carboxypeptidase